MAGETVLVIDDSPTILKVVQLALTKAGYRVETASDGEEGIAKALAAPPDLILLDFVMPKMNGYQVCRALSESKELKEVPVVLLSAKGEQVGERFVQVMGIVDYVTKPFTPEVITQVVAKALAHEPPPEQEPEVPKEALETVEARRSAPVESGPALEGNLRLVPLAEVLSLLGAQRQTGVLSVDREPARIELAFFRGRIALALASGLSEELLLGRYLIGTSTISRQDLDLFLENRADTGAPIGQQLLKMSYITESELREGLLRQTQERVFELLRWTAGHFSFTPSRKLPPLAHEAALGLEVEGVLLEGFRRIDEWHLIERELDDDELIFVRRDEAVQHLGRAQLSREELAVLELVNGKNTVKEIVRLSGKASFDVSKLLFRLLAAKVIRRRVAPVAVAP